MRQRKVRNPGRRKDLREGTPKDIAERLGVSDKLVRAILRWKYPRDGDEGKRRIPWGVIPPEKQVEVESVVKTFLLEGYPPIRILFPSNNTSKEAKL